MEYSTVTEGGSKPMIDCSIKKRYDPERNVYVLYIEEDEEFKPIQRNYPDTFRFDKYDEGLEARYLKYTGKDLWNLRP